MPLFNPKIEQYEQDGAKNSPGADSTPKIKSKSNLPKFNPGNTIRADPRWTGFTSHAPHISLALLVLIFINLILSGLLIDKRRKLYAINFAFGASSDLEFTIPRYNQIIFYELTTPIVSIFYTIIAIFLHRIRKSPPFASLISSSCFFIAWGTQLVIWGNCDTQFKEDGKLAVCSAWPMIDTGENGPVVWSRLAFGVFCALGYFGLMILAVVALQHKGLLMEVRQDVEDRHFSGKLSLDSLHSEKEDAAPVLPIVLVQKEARAA